MLLCLVQNVKTPDDSTSDGLTHRSLTESSFSLRSGSVDWLTSRDEIDEEQSGKRKRRTWRSIFTGRPIDGDWVTYSIPSDADRARANSQFDGSENVGRNTSTFYKLSVVAFAVGAWSLASYLPLSYVARGGWLAHMSVASVVWTIVSFIVVYALTLYAMTVSHKSFTPWTYFGSFFVTSCAFTYAYSFGTILFAST